MINRYLKLIFKDIAGYAPSKVCGLLGNLIVVPIYTSLLSREEYGLYAVSLAVLSFLCIIFSDWVGLSGLRFFREHQLSDKMSRYFSTLFTILAANLILMGILAYIFREQFYSYFKIPSSTFFFVLILIIPVAIRALFFQILRAQIKPIAYTVSTIVNQILTISIACILMKYWHMGAKSVLIGMFISISLTDILLIYQSSLHKFFKFEKLHLDITKNLFWYGIPISAAALGLWAINQSNKLIVSHYRTLSEVGLVGVAYSLSFPILMTLFSLLTIAAIPRIINFFEAKRDVRPLISKLTEYYMFIAVPLVAIYALYSKDIVTIFSAPKFADSALILPYLVIGALFLGLTEYTTIQYQLSKKTYINTIIKLLSGAIGVVLNIILLQKIGIAGIGIGTMCGNILYFILSICWNIKGLEWIIPYRQIVVLLINFVPFTILYKGVQATELNAMIQIAILLTLYYLTYIAIQKLIPKKI